MNRRVIAAIVLTGLVVGGCSHRAGSDQSLRAANLAVTTSTALDRGASSGSGGQTPGGISVPTIAGSPRVVVPTTLIPPGLNIPGVKADLNIKSCTLTITLQTDSVGFAFNSAAISPSGQRVVAAAAEALTGAQQVTVTGYTSSEGQYEYNMHLSVARAQAVANILGPLVPNAKFSVTGLGPNDPVVPNTTESQRSQNRRVVISAHVERSQCSP